MADQSPISQKTGLGPGDILKNRKDKLYRIDTFHGDKDTFKISPWPGKPGEENPSYIVISRDSLVTKQWVKMDKDSLKLPVASEVEEEEKVLAEGEEEEEKTEKEEKEEEDENEDEEEESEEEEEIEEEQDDMDL